MKLAAAERYIRNSLESIYPTNEAVIMADMLLEHFTSFSKGDRLMNKEADLTQQQEVAIHKGVERLLKHEPIQYIMNKCWFYGMELFVDPSVLIPRPETEELVAWIISDVRASGYKVFSRVTADADETDLLKILDVGTGSGCIALALKKAMPQAEVWGCDLSEEALNVARRNGSALDIRVDFQGLNFLDQLQQKQLPTVNILVSNPPYIPIRDKDLMNKNVVEHEPHTALFVPDEDPLIFYRALAKFASSRLHENGSIYMEIHEDLGNDVVRLFSDEGYNKIELRKDMQQKNRMVKVSK
ncbi:peptide chain release factor N(5)-glutamine methyltransferase [Flavisolibacter ginsengisoli]|jgi:release factor glutamine methyltransferase|uniref:peptide chain release factor N(5)-glutamine methyltransferase n=1 Tax=Flavisolibacter ginsengisoli DSM 18119 TaxID=1121884 RepID=A0A1M4T689_9BACT|nr:peptide chain release factor N(5)-glutamine methyltransferase [Flavisolibacter ginsengisoli]SHE40032.1 release factor glutamine methyltransferase [Flavisolibacter ginsengisoli DSM 18119]